MLQRPRGSNAVMTFEPTASPTAQDASRGAGQARPGAHRQRRDRPAHLGPGAPRRGRNRRPARPGADPARPGQRARARRGVGAAARRPARHGGRLSRRAAVRRPAARPNSCAARTPCRSPPASERATLAMADPLDVFTRNAVAAALGRPVAVAVAVPIELEAAFDRLYAEPGDGDAEPSWTRSSPTPSRPKRTPSG